MDRESNKIALEMKFFLTTGTVPSRLGNGHKNLRSNVCVCVCMEWHA